MDLGVKAFFGPDTTTEWFIEREAHPRKVLALRFPGVPVYEDITTVDHAQLAPIQCLIGGPPCTDLSVAGKGAGLHGEKSRLFFDMVEIAKSLQPRYVMIENSPVLLNKWRGTVEGAFADAGYGVTWARLSAAHIGAPHLRWRCFLLAELGAQHKGVCFPPALPSLTRWPTPAAFDVDGSRTLPAGTTSGGIKPNGKKAMIGLPNMVEHRWPTPTVSSGDQHALAPTPRMTGGTTLGGAVRWATPTAKFIDDGSDLDTHNARRGNNKAGKPIYAQVMRWNTPMARDWKDSGLEPGAMARQNPGLPAQVVKADVVRWATPQASDTKDRGTMGKTPAISRRVAIGKQITLSMQTDGARLSPDWLETLQGLPVNWTALEGELDPRPWPAHRVEGMWGDSPQHAHEPPRLCDPKQVPNRRARLKALGNLNPPQVYTRALEMLLEGPRQGVLFG
jgi:DNA (cytosine-5)-methyltransferase 1